VFYSLNKYLDDLLPVLHEIALKAVFPQEEVETVIRKQHQEFLVNMEKVNFVARQNFGALIFGKKHPYGQSAKDEDYRKINNRVLQQYFEKRYRRAPFSMILAGKIPEGIIGKLNKYFGQHPIAEHNAGSHIYPIEPSPDQSHFIEKPGALQSALRIGKPVINKLHPDYQKLKVLNTLFGGYFGSRLMTNIREDKGYTYGIGSGIVSFRYTGMFYIASEVGAEVTRKAFVEIDREIEKLINEPVHDEELELVKSYMTGNFLRSADGPFALAELFRSVLPFGLTMDYYRDFLSTIKTITTEEIINLAVTYLQPDSLIRLTVGNPETVNQ